MKLRQILYAAALCIAGVAAPAHAALLNPVLVPGLNEFQDTDAERILRNGSAITTSNFQVGDVIQTILRFDTINASTITDLLNANGGPLPNSYQLNAIAELKVAAIYNPNTTTACNLTVCTLVFAPSGNLGANVFASVYERVSPQPGFSTAVGVAPATALANIGSQTLIAQLGIGEVDDFWAATTLRDIGLAAGLTSASPQVANGQFGLSLISNAGGIPVATNTILGADGNLHDFVGNASAYQRSPGVDPGWLLSSNTTVDFNVRAVPEPASLALVGIALVGLGFASRRRRG